MTKRTRPTLPSGGSGRHPDWGRMEACPVPTAPAALSLEGRALEGRALEGRALERQPARRPSLTWNAHARDSPGGRARPTVTGWSARSRPAGPKKAIPARAASRRCRRGWRTSWSGPRTISSARLPAWRSGGTGIRTAGAPAATGIAKLVSMTPDSRGFDPASYVFSQPSAPTAIRASTVLPAHRENVELRTADGHRRNSAPRIRD